MAANDDEPRLEHPLRIARRCIEASRIGEYEEPHEPLLVRLFADAIEQERRYWSARLAAERAKTEEWWA